MSCYIFSNMIQVWVKFCTPFCYLNFVISFFKTVLFWFIKQQNNYTLNFFSNFFIKFEKNSTVSAIIKCNKTLVGVACLFCYYVKFIVNNSPYQINFNID